MFCHKVHKIASEFIRHVNYYHLDEHGTKATYMRTMSQELNNEVVRQLYRAKRACMKKRRLEGGDAGPETPQARRVRLDEGMAAANPHIGDYVDRPTLPVISAAGDIAVTPIDSFQDLVARELCNRANNHDAFVASLTTTDTAVAPTDFQSTAQAFYPDPGRELGYDPDITRIANWPAGWDETVNQILNGVS